jgi:hypothetical protein
MRRICRDFPSRFATALAAVIIAAVFAGCAPAALSSARAKLAAGQYAEARADLLALKAHQAELSTRDRREVNDDLCLADFMIGRPRFALAEQRRVCAEAVALAGSQSADILARIDSQLRAETAAEVEAALKARDLAAAEDAALRYQAAAGADSAVMKGWAARMWKLAAEQTAVHRRSKRTLAPVIAEIRKRNPAARNMSDGELEGWIRSTATVAGTPMVSRVDLDGGSLRVWIAQSSVAAAERNLDRFTAINDALAAHCGCDASTTVGVAETGFPVYFVSLDPETRMSEVLIIPRGRLDSPPAAPG